MARRLLRWWEFDFEPKLEEARNFSLEWFELDLQHPYEPYTIEMAAQSMYRAWSIVKDKRGYSAGTFKKDYGIEIQLIGNTEKRVRGCCPAIVGCVSFNSTNPYLLLNKK